MNASGLINHKLFEYLMLTTRDFISRQSPKGIISPPSSKEKRAVDILLSASKIIESLDQIYFTIELLSGYRQKRGSIINRHDYIVFMLENFYLRITSVLDRALRLTNLVYKIGLPEKECRESTIIKNLKIEGSTVEKSLKKLLKYVNEFKPIRNQVAHQSTFHDDELNNLEGFYLVIESNPSDEIRKYQHHFKSEADKYVLKRKNELKELADKMKDLISDFFTALKPIIKEDIETYK